MNYLGIIQAPVTVTAGGTTAECTANPNTAGGVMYLKVTALTGGATFHPKLEAYDVASGGWYGLMDMGAVTGTAFNKYLLYPLASADAAYLPSRYRITYTLTAAASCTFSIGINYL